MSVGFVSSAGQEGQRRVVEGGKYLLLSKEDVRAFRKLTYDALRMLGNSPDQELSLKARVFSKLSEKDVIKLMIPDEKSEQLALLDNEKQRLQIVEEELVEALKEKDELNTEDPVFFEEFFSNYTEQRNIDTKLSKARKKHALAKCDDPDNLDEVNDEINFLSVKKLAITKNIEAAKKMNCKQALKVCMLEIKISCAQDEINLCYALITALEEKLSK